MLLFLNWAMVQLYQVTGKLRIPNWFVKETETRVFKDALQQKRIWKILYSILYYQPKLANVQRLKLTNRALVRSYSLWRRANALNVSFKTLYGFQSTLLTQLLKLNYPVILSHPRSTKISLETSPSNKRKLGFFSIKHLMHKPFDLFGKYPQGNK